MMMHDGRTISPTDHDRHTAIIPTRVHSLSFCTAPLQNTLAETVGLRIVDANRPALSDYGEEIHEVTSMTIWI